MISLLFLLSLRLNNSERRQNYKIQSQKAHSCTLLIEFYFKNSESTAKMRKYVRAHCNIDLYYILEYVKYDYVVTRIPSSTLTSVDIIHVDLSSCAQKA